MKKLIIVVLGFLVLFSLLYVDGYYYLRVLQVLNIHVDYYTGKKIIEYVFFSIKISIILLIVYSLVQLIRYIFCNSPETDNNNENENKKYIFIEFILVAIIGIILLIFFTKIVIGYFLIKLFMSLKNDIVNYL